MVSGETLNFVIGGSSPSSLAILLIEKKYYLQPEQSRTNTHLIVLRAAIAQRAHRTGRDIIFLTPTDSPTRFILKRCGALS